MGRDIHTHAEIKKDATWQTVLIDSQDLRYIDFPFGWRSSPLYAFLTDGGGGYGPNARPPMPSLPDSYRGLPADSQYLDEPLPVTDWRHRYWKTERKYLEDDDNSSGFSWVTLAELLAFDYEQPYETTRPILTEGKGWLRNEDGTLPTLPYTSSVREELGDEFFAHLDLLRKLGPPEDVRVVFWFS